MSVLKTVQSSADNSPRKPTGVNVTDDADCVDPPAASPMAAGGPLTLKGVQSISEALLTGAAGTVSVPKLHMDGRSVSHSVLISIYTFLFEKPVTRSAKTWKVASSAGLKEPH